MITWDDFNNTNSANKQTAFENMCRILFNYHFFDNKAIFKQKFNNPGVEIEPIELKKQKISFQSKYIESGTVYPQLSESIEKAITNYLGELDTIYIFCNKNIDENSKSYKEIKETAQSNHIKLECICNQEILTMIEANSYNTIKCLFFGKHNLSKEWFESNLKTALEDLAPRYVSGFNINTDIQNYFELKYLSKEIYDLLLKNIDDWKKRLNYLRIDHNIMKNIVKKLEQLTIPEKQTFQMIFEWYKQFDKEKSALSNILKSYDKQLQTNKLNKKDISEIYEKRSETYRALELLQEIDLSQDTLFKTYKSNVLLVEGDAGIGKSHLLGFEAEKHADDFNRTILLLGQKLIGDNSPLNQIKEQLNTSLDFDNLLDALEGLGEIDGSDTIIMIDALNESSNHKIWKNYLNTLINKILSYRHIKLIATIRSTYKDRIFSESILNKIDKKEIFLIKHYGFEGNFNEAITIFFNHYKIPTSIISYLGYAFSNPLFLKIYCEAYSGTYQDFGSVALSDVFDRYINKEEDKIKDMLDIDDHYHYCTKILDNIALYLFDNEKICIDIDTLYEINKGILRYEEFIPKILRSKLLVSYIGPENKEIVYFGYEKIFDFRIANILLDRYSSQDTLFEFLIKDLFKTDNNELVRNNVLGIFSALSILYSNKHKDEIIQVLDKVNLDDYHRQLFLEEYLNNMIYRDDKSIKRDMILSLLRKSKAYSSLLPTFYTMLISLAGRENNPLNANYLHENLTKKALNIRDATWTLFINENFEPGNVLYIVISFFNTNVFDGNSKSKQLYAILLTWLLTSSNRSLRDKTSRCLVNLLKNDYDLMSNVLKLFKDTNDPYIIQRLYGVIYGAVLKSDKNITKLTFLATQIFKYIFNKDVVYEDILLRDYALNIIEYANYLKCPLRFEIKKCRPPYKSTSIPTVCENVEDFYVYDKKNFTGANSIKSSLTPNLNGGYGDFGRYVFEYALSYFNGIDLKNLYLYCLDYIKNELGYNNELFSDYDRYVQRLEYNRHSTSKIERIGKKYEWIAFYRVLALVSDKYTMSTKYNDLPSNKYIGSWNPYVRDFDPTLDLVNSNRVYNCNLSLKQPVYNNWTNERNWALNKEDVLNFKELIFLKDNNFQEWIFLHGHLHQKTTTSYEESGKEVWRMVNAYIIKTNKYSKFINKLKNKPLWGRWFSEPSDNYTIFNREYCWSPAYKDVIFNGTFDVEIDTDKKVTRTIKVPQFEFKDNADQKTFEILTVGEEINTYETIIKENIGVVKPLWDSYLWEEQYDASKDETIGIYLPTGDIVTGLGLEQKNSGIFYHNDEIVAADFSYIKGNTEGLYIKKTFLDKFLKDNDYSIFWVCIGEKNDIKRNGLLDISKDSIFKDFSSLVYFKNGKIKSSDFFGDRRNN